MDNLDFLTNGKDYESISGESIAKLLVRVRRAYPDTAPERIRFPALKAQKIIAQGSALGWRIPLSQSPWLFEFLYCLFLSSIVELGLCRGEEASSPLQTRARHTASPRSIEIVLQQGGHAHSRLQFGELPEPKSS